VSIEKFVFQCFKLVSISLSQTLKNKKRFFISS